MTITYHPRKKEDEQVAIFISLTEYGALLAECQSIQRRTLPLHGVLLHGLVDVGKLIKEKG